MTNEIASTRELSNWYYTLACVLILFGLLGLLSIGLPFLVLGVAMFLLAPFAKRRSPLVLPILIGITTFWAILFTLGPVTCSETVIRSEQREGRRHPIQVQTSTACNQEPDALPTAVVGGAGIGLLSWIALRPPTE